MSETTSEKATNSTPIGAPKPPRVRTKIKITGVAKAKPPGVLRGVMRQKLKSRTGNSSQNPPEPMVPFNVRIPRTVYVAMKLYAVRQSVSLQEFMTETLREKIKRVDKHADV